MKQVIVLFFIMVLVQIGTANILLEDYEEDENGFIFGGLFRPQVNPNAAQINADKRGPKKGGRRYGDDWILHDTTANCGVNKGGCYPNISWDQCRAKCQASAACKAFEMPQPTNNWYRGDKWNCCLEHCDGHNCGSTWKTGGCGGRFDGLWDTWTKYADCPVGVRLTKACRCGARSDNTCSAGQKCTSQGVGGRCTAASNPTKKPTAKPYYPPRAELGVGSGGAAESVTDWFFYMMVVVACAAAGYYVGKNRKEKHVTMNDPKLELMEYNTVA